MSASAALLGSEARVAAAQSPTIRQALGVARGVLLILDITATPNNAETLTPSIQVYDPITKKFQTLTAFAASKTGAELGAAPTTATLLYSMYPAALETAAIPNHEVQGLALPAFWRAVVTPSAGGSWTYTLGYQGLA